MSADGRAWADSEYSRVYHSIGERMGTDFGDLEFVGAWTKLLVAADAAWPTPAPIPRWLTDELLERLEAAGLVRRIGAESYTVAGLAKERAARAGGRAVGGRARAASALRDPVTGQLLPSRRDDERPGPGGPPDGSDSVSAAHRAREAERSRRRRRSTAVDRGRPAPATKPATSSKPSKKPSNGPAAQLETETEYEYETEYEVEKVPTARDDGRTGRVSEETAPRASPPRDRRAEGARDPWEGWHPAWAPIRAAMRSRRLRRPPTPEQRAMLWQIVDAGPERVARWIGEPPAGTPMADVVAHVLARWHELEAAVPDDVERRVTPRSSSGPLPLRAIVG